MTEHLHLNLGGEDFESTPENTTLFTFLGTTALNGAIVNNAQFNHVFFQKGNEDDNTLVGSYMFRTINNEGVFDTIMTHIASEDYPMVLNRRDVPECDITAYNNMVENVASQEHAEDFIPDEWLNEGA